MLNIDKYIGLPYSARHFDCGDLAILLQKELFGNEVELAGKRLRPLNPDRQAEVLALYCADLGEKTETPQDGDAILMREVGSNSVGHIGTYFLASYTPSVLHTSEVLGGSRLHRLSDLPGLGLSITGYYKWKRKLTE